MNDPQRSKKIDEILLNPPKKILIIGPILALILVSSILILSYYLPCPERVQVNLIITNSDKSDHLFRGVAFIDQTLINKIKRSQEVIVFLDKYPKKDFGVIPAKVSDIDVKLTNGKYRITMTLRDYNSQIKLEDGLSGKCRITINNGSFLKRIILKSFKS